MSPETGGDPSTSGAPATVLGGSALAGATVAGRRPGRRAGSGLTRYRGLIAVLVLLTVAAAAGFLLIGRGSSSDVASISLDGQPTDVVAGDGVVWVATGENSDNGRVAQVHPGSGDETDTPMPVGGTPLRMAVGGGGVWIGTLERKLVHIDAATGRPEGKPQTVDQAPHGMAIGHGAVWIADGGGIRRSRCYQLRSGRADSRGAGARGRGRGNQRRVGGQLGRR